MYFQLFRANLGRRLVRINDQLLNESETPTKITGGYGSPGPDGGHIRPLFLHPK